jgi:hypothetical protein
VRRVVVDARSKANETRRPHAGGEETVHRSWAEREPPVPSTLAALASRQSALVPSVVTAGVTLAALCLDAGERARLRVPSSLSLSPSVSGRYLRLETSLPVFFLIMRFLNSLLRL